MEEGYVKIHRKMLEWEWFDDSTMVHLFLYMILKANFKEKTWKGIHIKRGQFVCGIHELSSKLGVSVQSLRTAIKKLKSTNEITTESTNQFTVVTICKYDIYNPAQDESNKQINKPSTSHPTNDQQTNNKRLTTTKNVNKEKTVKKEDLAADGPPPPSSSRKKKAAASAEPYWDGYVKTFDAFYSAKFIGEEHDWIEKSKFKDLHSIVQKLKKRADRAKQEWSEESAKKWFLKFLYLAYQDKFLSTNFTMHNLNRQFETVYQKAIEAKKSEEKKVEPKKTFEQEISYLFERYKEGGLNTAIIDPQYYDKLVTHNYLQVGSMAKYEADTIEEQKVKAILGYFENLKQKQAV